MIQQGPQLFPDLDEAPSQDPTYLLQELEVFNWGPFTGLHRADIDPNGTAIIGPTGSGKTTLIDALMTLLVEFPRYNLASTGGHESDRTLISYIRGVLGGDGADGREEVARPAKTVTGLCATYKSGEEQLKLAGILWTEGSSHSMKDLKRRWLFSRAKDQSLENWVRLLHEESVRELTRHGHDTAGLRIFKGKREYLAHTRKFFDVGENAFTLLNRAAGLKQLNSIDEIFRELVLDDRTAFDRALEVAAEFDNLAEIHAELETARRQQESLIPIGEGHRKLEKSRDKARKLHLLKHIIPIWFAMAGEQRWSNELRRLANEREQKESLLDKERQQEKTCSSRTETLQGRYLELGGEVIGQLEQTIVAQKEQVAERLRHAESYRRMVRKFRLNEELCEVALHRNQAKLKDENPAVQQRCDAAETETLEARSRQRDHEEKAAEVELMLRKVKERPGSNIPPTFQDFRTELAETLGVAEAVLPFLAELVEVKPDEAAWRGAIERAIGSERLRILVPEKELKAALKWVNSRDNRLHVRLQAAKQNVQAVRSFPDGYLLKLNFKKHSMIGAAKELLARHDRHCVNSPEGLRRIEHGMTIEGTMSGRRGKFEKQDQRRLHEGWLTGFDNKDQLKALARQLLALQESVRSLKATTNRCQAKLRELQSQLTMIERLVELEFSTINLPGAEADLARSEERLASLLDPQSDSSKAKAAYEVEQKQLESIRKQITEFEKGIAVLEDRERQAEEARTDAILIVGDGLNEEETELARNRLPIDSNVEAKQLGKLERQKAKELEQQLEKQEGRVKEREQSLIRQMGAAQRADTGALAETGTELSDIPDYLERLRVLTEEALPDKQTRFLDYLNRSSDQGVTQLLAGIDEEVDGIEQRITELNQTLLKVDFRSKRYLQLQPQRIKHERLRSLENAMRRLRNAALKDDQGESHYKALNDLVAILRDAGQNRRQQGPRALLDPRYRLQFFVVEVDRITGNRSPPRTGSQSGSGGEKELMASHILTASLSYALCPAEATRPLYGTVILDEAFSKSSPSAATRIIEALRIFHLHPIFVTPNKEIGLLKQHTRRVICVQRPKKEASLVSISWEKLEGLAHPK